MGQVFLAKSGTTDFDEQDRFVGTLDLPVNVRGEAEIAEITQELSGADVQLIYFTTGASARQTGEKLAAALSVKSKELEGLKNLDFGLWQGLPVAEVQRKHRRLYAKWKESPCEACPPAGEELSAVYQRVEKVLGPIIRKNSFKAIVIVAPDPLRQIIRCYLTDRNVQNVLLDHQSDSIEQISV